MKVQKKSLLLLGLLSFAGFMAVPAIQAGAKEPKVIQNISYVPGSSNPFQQLDLYLPKWHAGPMPVVVWIHGGAWLMGDKNHPPADLLCPRGFAVASINYRLAQQAEFPAQINDCKAAVRWLRAHAKEYNLDPEHIGVWGHSAGGHLAALLATSGGVKELEGDGGNLSYSSRVQAAADWAGLSDLVSVVAQAPANCQIDFKTPSKSPVVALMGSHQSQEACLKASPIYYISKDDPPLLVVHGDKDDIVPVEQSKEFCEALKKAGANAQCIIVKGQGHGLGDLSVYEKTVIFLKRNLQIDESRYGKTLSGKGLP